MQELQVTWNFKLMGKLIATVAMHSFLFNLRMGKGDGKGKGAAHFDEATLEVYKECFKLVVYRRANISNELVFPENSVYVAQEMLFHVEVVRFL